MTTTPPPSTTGFQRLRMRFRKEGDLRWASHRDLMRTMERLCRRARLPMRMSAGFHPKPKMHFPCALALGIEGHGEVLEWELTEPLAPSCVQQRLVRSAPPGLVVTSVEEVAPGRAKARVAGMRYEFPVPRERWEQVEQAIARLMAASSLPIQRSGRPAPVDLRAPLTDLQLRDGMVRWTMQTSAEASAGPRDLLQALGLAELEHQGCVLTRVEVTLVTEATGSPL